MKVIVEAFSRLHLGLFELGKHFGRQYGGIGVYVDRPRLRVFADNSADNIISGDLRQLALETVREVEAHFGKRFSGELAVSSNIPVHKGFGATTQLKLAVATAVTKTWQLDVAPSYLGKILGRGGISNVGTLLFGSGGLVIEFPKKQGADKTPSFIRLDFPDEWRFLVIYPINEVGPDDETERMLFERLGPMDSDKCMEASHLVLSRLLPSLLEKDIVEFGEALSALQRLVGDHFSKLQGGIYRSQRAADLLIELGAFGVGQSSWGPAVYGLFGDAETAALAAEHAMKHLGNSWVVFTTKAVNHGAISSITP
ncbi:MAG: hypothetical protein RMI49_02350 [Candidatus Caldarchaeum sp.]|nr:hypothetical protein [Candidatus Caldarchaeum sp.]